MRFSVLVSFNHNRPGSHRGDLRRTDYCKPTIDPGGEGGIRTLGALRLTRSPGVRVRPDYATSPHCQGYPPRVSLQRPGLYHKGL
jgi:hypothetical protein